MGKRHKKKDYTNQDAEDLSEERMKVSDLKGLSMKEQMAYGISIGRDLDIAKSIGDVGKKIIRWLKRLFSKKETTRS